jgi:hypothetical protein
MSAQGKTISCKPNSDSTISLYNRDGFKTYLEPITDSIYVLRSEIDFGIRIIYDGNNESLIMAVDPAGGPFMSIGDVIDGREIVKIEYNKDLKGFTTCLQTRK